MPTISKYVEVTGEQMRMIAGHIEAWLQRTGLTYDDFADRYNQLAKRYPPGTVVTMTATRVLSYVNLARGKKCNHVAKVPYCREVEIISLVVGIPVKELIGEESESTLQMLKVADSTTEPAVFVQLMKSRQAETRELIGLAEFLPCSLETPEFMHCHHQALFKGYAGSRRRDRDHISV